MTPCFRCTHPAAACSHPPHTTQQHSRPCPPAAKVDALHTGKGQQPLRKAAGAADPAQRPLRLAPHHRHSLHRVQQVIPLHRVPHILVQQQAVHLAVHILDGNLEAVEGACLR